MRLQHYNAPLFAHMTMNTKLQRNVLLQLDNSSEQSPSDSQEISCLL